MIKQLADVASWHGLIDDQISAWLVLCDAWIGKADLDDATRCLRHLDSAGLVLRLDAIAKQRKEQGLLEHWKQHQ